MTYKNGKDEVLARYQPIFSPYNILTITKEEFKSFFLYKNNHHWGGLHRFSNFMTADIDLLRKALSILVDERLPIILRLDRILRKSGAMVPCFGRATIAPILMIAYPEKYGVMNNTLEASFGALNI